MLDKLNPFARPSYAKAIQTSLENARLNLLNAEAMLEHAQATVQMHRASVARLEKLSFNLMSEQAQ